MKPIFRTLFVVLSLTFGLLACDRDTSISDSDGGSQTGDGGGGSAQYAGTYVGNTHITYSGDGIDGNDNLDSTIRIHTDGTVSFTVDGETIDGVSNGNQIDIGLEVKRTEDGIRCTGDIAIRASVRGSTVSGPVDGDADCRLLTVKRSADIDGSIHATRR